MAILFDDASSEYLEYAGAVVAAAPLTMACWFNSDDVANYQSLMAIGADSQDGFYLYAAGGDTGDPLWAGAARSTSAIAKSSTGYSANTWHHACAVFAAANDRRAFIDGGSKGTDATSRIPASLDVTSIGRIWYDGAAYYHMSGKIAEAAMWNVALSDDEVAALAAYVCPLFIRPDDIVAYWPMHNVSILADVIGTYPMTAFNTPASAADHAPVRMPGGSISLPAAAAPPAGVAPTSHLYGSLVGPLGGPV